MIPTVSPSVSPTSSPTVSPTKSPTTLPTEIPTQSPTNSPSTQPTPAGVGGINDGSYCTPSSKCSLGQGHCDSDNDCASGLTCGNNNCRSFHPTALPSSDCCYDKPGIGASDDINYCTSSSKCSEGEGHCDSNAECAAGLTCGNNNCLSFHPTALPTSDCCYDKPGIGASDDTSYCTSSSRCSEGEGHCDSNMECAAGLTCGSNNCRDFHPNAASNTGCCYDKPGIGASDDLSYCTSSRKCSVGQGDCDTNLDCAAGLTCGTDNCRDFHPNADRSADCCYDKPGIGSSDDGRYCRTNRKCSVGQGDCDIDRECAAGLTCGIDNCRDFHPNAASNTDCCYKQGVGASDDKSYCRNRKCSVGEGDCDSDDECASGLTCGNHNCQSFHPITALPTSDCCYVKPGIGASGDKGYCKPSRQCSEGQGDCDSDNDCASGLACGKDNCQNYHVNADPTTDCCVRKIYLSRTLSDYKNSWNGRLSYTVPTNRMITGFYSNHNNDREDRRWRFYSGSASGVSCHAGGWSTWANQWEGSLSFTCKNNQALNGVYSYHNNGKGDRLWKFKCCSVSNAYLRNGGWTNYVNGWDSLLNFQCSKYGVIVGVSSYHDHRREDRRWKFRCAELLKK